MQDSLQVYVNGILESNKAAIAVFKATITMHCFDPGLFYLEKRMAVADVVASHDTSCEALGAEATQVALQQILAWGTGKARRRFLAFVDGLAPIVTTPISSKSSRTCSAVVFYICHF